MIHGVSYIDSIAQLVFIHCKLKECEKNVRKSEEGKFQGEKSWITDHPSCFNVYMYSNDKVRLFQLNCSSQSSFFTQMATVSGACVISKVSGLLQVREDTAPSKLMWKAIDQDKSLEIPLNCLSKLQSSPDSSPKMLLKLFYTVGTDPVDVKLTFNNRLTMNAVKEALQTIVARQKTIIKDMPASTEPGSSCANTPAANTPKSGSPTPGNPLDFSSSESLSDQYLLKNHQLQQKLLLEDRNLRNIFTQSVIKFKLSPMIFWSTRVSQLRTYALTISQHRGPYNVLSTIRPVATSDNQVNVNVTRDTITEIFDTYPIIRRAFAELVPTKLNEGEFWSRFFNSKLFRRLRGDKINTLNTRGDMVIDNYLYVDADFVEEEERSKKTKVGAELHHVNKFIDLFGNAEDNSQKLGLSPDFTMKFSSDEQAKNTSAENPGTKPKGENEMVILMKNMNKLSSKMVDLNSTPDQVVPEEKKEQELEKEHEHELNLADLNEADELHYIELHLDTAAARYSIHKKATTPEPHPVSEHELGSFLGKNVFAVSANGINLSETYESKTEEINKATLDITGLVKHNFRTNKSLNNLKDTASGTSILPEEYVQELIRFNITIMEFLLHFWNLFLNAGNPAQLKKLFASLRNCQQSLTVLEKKISEHIQNHEQVKLNERLRDKLLKGLDNCVSPLTTGLSKACADYATAVRASNEEINGNGKRPLVA